MVITYNGLEFFKVQSGELTLVFNPVSKNSKHKITPPRFRSDIAFVTTNHPDFNGTHGLSGKDDKETIIIDGPGEYEIQNVFVNGFQTVSHYGGKEIINTIYKVILEDITLCFLGALSDKNIPEEVLAEIEETDILFIPIGGEGVLNASEAYKLSVKITPHVIIPTHYGLVGEKDSLNRFLKEHGSLKSSPLDKLTTKKNLLVVQEGEVVVLNSVND